MTMHLLHTNYHTTHHNLKNFYKTVSEDYDALNLVKCPFLTVIKGRVTIGTRARPGQLLIVRLKCVDNKLLPNIIYHTNSILPPNSTHLKCMQ